MRPSAIDSSTPPAPVHSPAAKTPGSVVACCASTASTVLPSTSCAVAHPSKRPGSAFGTSPKPTASRSQASVSARSPWRSCTDSSRPAPCAAMTWVALRYCAVNRPSAWNALPGQRHKPAAKPAICAALACSATHSTCAPALRALAAAASSKGPLPAITMRWPRTGKPPLISACSAPAPVTPGRVQPGKGSSNSRAPVQRISASKGCIQACCASSSSNALVPCAATTRVPHTRRTSGHAASAERKRWAGADGAAPGPLRQI